MKNPQTHHLFSAADPAAVSQNIPSPSRRWRILLCGLAMWLLAGPALPNGGPFVIKYPGGDPAAKGVLARLSPDLKPARESRLQVVKEDLTLQFMPVAVRTRSTAGKGGQDTPLVAVTAEYLITNPTPDRVEVDFGFPIMRGIYLNPYGMVPMPEVRVRVNNKDVPATLISNSAIYGLLRRLALATIENALAAKPDLAGLMDRLGDEPAGSRETARAALSHYLEQEMKWTPSEAALLLEYAELCPGDMASGAGQEANKQGRVHLLGMVWGRNDDSLREAASEAAWAVRVIGEQKATQWLALLANRLDPSSARTYESIFGAWGGDVRERSVDLITGGIRPRVISLEPPEKDAALPLGVLPGSDPTVYARVEYLSANANLPEPQKRSWKNVLKHLPVIFTFAPMNLLHYQVAFAPGEMRTVTVSYRQFAFLDTASPSSYQVAYVLHPASLWDSFGPIHLTVLTPEGILPVSSSQSDLTKDVAKPGQPLWSSQPAQPTYQAYGTILREKTGELFVGINVQDWADVMQVKAASAKSQAAP